MDQQQQLTPDDLAAERLPFDVEFFKLSETFSADVLKKIPELSGVAIVPLWTKQPENTPAGLLKLRNAQPPYIAGLLQLLGRLTAFAVDVHRDFLGQLQMFDRYANELAAQIKDRVTQLSALSQSEPDTPPNDDK
jgi:hypothetical protein